MKPVEIELGPESRSATAERPVAAAATPARSGPVGAVNDPWMQHMRRGDFEAAWRVSDRVLIERGGAPCGHLPRHQQAIWNGTPLAGRRVLIRCYHGLGDTIQFVRYVPLVKRIAREVTLWVQPSLLPWLAPIAGADRVLPLHDGVPAVAYDVDVELMELPYVFRTTLGAIPPPPNCRASSKRSRNDCPGRIESSRRNVSLRRKAHLGRTVNLGLTANPWRRRVGLVWCSGDWDDRRSVPVRSLAPLAAIPGISLHPLQRGRAAADWPRCWGESLAAENVQELACTMRELDLVISVDTFPLHLAATLGVPTWGLLHADPDWRWMLDRTDSPWYPALRLWRQDATNGWEPLLERVAAELRLMMLA